MDIKQIQELVKIINKTNISEISIEEQDFKITIKQKEEVVHVAQQQPMYTMQQPMQQQPIQQMEPAAITPPETPKVADNLITVKSPMIGTFYRKSGPDKPVFVEVGTEITPGKVVCIIEAMKLFNEIESEVKGKVVKILVEDSSPVEYDQPLFLVDPS